MDVLVARNSIVKKKIDLHLEPPQTQLFVLKVILALDIYFM